MTVQAAGLVPGQKVGMLDLLGPTVEFIVPPDQPGAAYCVLRGTLAPGVSIPMHAHADVETFTVLTGTAQALVDQATGLTWLDLGPGESIHIPSNAKHAWRNVASEPVQMVITTTPKMGGFFTEVGRPVRRGVPAAPPEPTDLQRFLDVSDQYRYWNASPDENAAVGIHLA